MVTRLDPAPDLAMPFTVGIEAVGQAPVDKHEFAARSQ